MTRSQRALTPRTARLLSQSPSRGQPCAGTPVHRHRGDTSTRARMHAERQQQVIISSGIMSTLLSLLMSSLIIYFQVSKSHSPTTVIDVSAPGILVLSWPGHLVLNLYSKCPDQPECGINQVLVESDSSSSTSPSLSPTPPPLCCSRSPSPSLSSPASVLRAQSSPSNSPPPSRSRSPRPPGTPSTPRYSININNKHYYRDIYKK